MPIESFASVSFLNISRYILKHLETRVAYVTFHPGSNETNQVKLTDLIDFMNIVHFFEPDNAPGPLHVQNDLLISLVDLDASPWSPGGAKYTPAYEFDTPCWFPTIITIEYELQLQTTMYVFEMRCQNGMALCFEPIPMVRGDDKSGGPFETTLKETIHRSRREFNGFPILVRLYTDESVGNEETPLRDLISHGTASELALQPYIALSKT